MEKATKSGARPPLPPCNPDWVTFAPPKSYISCSNKCRPLIVERVERQGDRVDKPVPLRTESWLHPEIRQALVDGGHFQTE